MSSTRILKAVTASVGKFSLRGPVRGICGYSATPDEHMMQQVEMHLSDIHHNHKHGFFIEKRDVYITRDLHISNEQPHHAHHEKHHKRDKHHGKHGHHVKDHKPHSHVEDSYKEHTFKAW
jgi:hypothetical protein